MVRYWKVRNGSKGLIWDSEFWCFFSDYHHHLGTVDSLVEDSMMSVLLIEVATLETPLYLCWIAGS